MKEILEKPLFDVLKAVMESIQQRKIAPNHRKIDLEMVHRRTGRQRSC